MAEDLIRMEHINKFYGRVQALDDVNFSVTRKRNRRPPRRQRRRQVDAHQGAVRRRARDERRHHLRGSAPTSAARRMRSRWASRRSIRISALVTQFSIARNLFLGREPLKGPRFLNRLDQR